MSKETKAFNPSWFMVIVMLSAFWPVGLYFLWSKLQTLDAPTPEKPRKRGLRTGGIIAILGALFLGATEGISGFWMVFWMLGGAALMYFDRYQQKREGKLTHYRAVIGDNHSMAISEIASAIGVDYNTACRDLKQMIDDKYFSKGAYLDYGNGMFVSHSQYAPKGASAPKAQKQSEKTKQTAATASPEPQSRPHNGPVEEENEYVRWLTQIRTANHAIKDERLSDQIDEIEQYTANIFECVVERPEKKREIHTFMNYYLPTTLKLLNAYARLERQNVNGGGIEESKKNIEGLVDQLVFAFKRQNEQMFEKDAMDISSDIKVMETMLARDGLSGNGFAQSHFAAAQRKQ